MKSKLKVLAVALIAGGSMFAQTRLSIGVNVGGYGPGVLPPPPAYAAYRPACPGPGYTWVDGYWTPQGGRNVWIDGFWRAPAVVAAPHYVAPRYVPPRGFGHNDFRADRGHDRGDDRGHDRDRGFRR